MVSFSLSTVGPPGADSLVWGGGLLAQNRPVFVLKPSGNAGFSLAEGGGGDAGIPASVSVSRSFGDQVHEHFAQLLAL